MLVDLKFEIGEDFSVYVDREISGFGFSFGSLICEELWSSPSVLTGALKQVMNEVREVMNELHVDKPSHCFILKFDNYAQFMSNRVSSNGFFLLRLPVRPLPDQDIIDIHFRYKKNEEFDRRELYHELMHIKDIIDGKFPTIGKSLNVDLLNNLWGFSINGRLQNMKKPHMEKDEAISWLNKEVELGLITKEHVKRLYIDLRETHVTYSKLKSIVEEIIGSNFSLPPRAR